MENGAGSGFSGRKSEIQSGFSAGKHGQADQILSCFLRKFCYFENEVAFLSLSQNMNW